MKGSNLQVHVSNRLEILADALADLYRDNPPAPLQPETVVVQSRGMARWLSLQLARRLGVALNIDFPFPRAQIDALLAVAGLGPPDPDPFAPDSMAWTIWQAMPQVIAGNTSHPLARYWSDQPPAAQFQFASRVAGLFDEYLLYRPDMILAWDGGAEPNDWQARLWRTLSETLGPDHFARRSLHFLASDLIRDVPFPRLSLFGMATLPPLCLEIIARLRIRTHLFLVEPTPEYWADFTSLKRNARNRPPGEAGMIGHPLLHSLGKLGRDFQNQLLEYDITTGSERFEIPLPHSRLGILQSEIYAAEPPPAADQLPLADASIRLHACHSRLREVEILRDDLLERFESMPGLRPEDILVLAPAIEEYAPLIRAVFDPAESDAPHIPYTIADRHPRSEDAFIDAFLALLDIPESRFTRSGILAFLERPTLSYDFDEDALGSAREACVRANIRWGAGAHHRQDLDLPATAQHTWAAGLDRLLLGAMLPEDSDALFAGVAPVPWLSPEDARAVGKVAEAVQELDAFRNDSGKARTLTEWGLFLGEQLERFFAVDPTMNPPGRRQLLRTFNWLGRLPDAGLVPFAVVRASLANALSQSAQSGGFLAGGVTFCSLVPMRAIPARVVCLLGMNEGEFPRRPHPESYNKIRATSRTGDRNPREDDRFLFLETLLAARESLHISYSGASLSDDKKREPAAPVAELMGSVPGLAAVFHPLQAFNPRAFGGSGSYSTANARAAEVLRRGGAIDPRPLLDQALPDPPPELLTIDPSALCAFLANSAKYLAKERLAIDLPTNHEEPGDIEPFSLSSLDAFFVRQELVDAHLAGAPTDPIRLRQIAADGLPPGDLGAADFEKLRQEAKGFADALPPEARSPRISLPVDLHLGVVHILGSCPAATSGDTVTFRVSKPKASSILEAWVLHLLRSASGRPGDITRGIWLGKEHLFAPVPDPIPALSTIAALYARGLREPLPLFPESSFAYARKLAATGGDAVAALAAAEQKWWSSHANKRPESADPWFDLLFHDVNPLDAQFALVAEAVFGPLLEATRTG